MTQQRTAVATIILAGLLIRLVGLGSKSVWYDEAFSLLFAQTGPRGMLQGTLALTPSGVSDVHPLGYYTLLWAWLSALGPSVEAGRALSLIAGLGVMILTHLISREVVGRRSAIWGAVLCAVLPFQVHYSQEIRMYALLTMWLLLAVYTFLRGRATGNWRWWAAFSLSAALAQYTHHLAAFFLVPLSLSAFFDRGRRTALSVSLASGGALLLYLPWLSNLVAQFGRVQTAYWIQKPGVDRFFALLLVYLPNLPLRDTWLAPALVAAAVVISWAGLQTIRSIHLHGPDFPGGPWLSFLAFAPPTLMWMISQAWPVYVERALLPSHAMFCIWLAWALNETHAPRPIVGSCAVLVATLAGAGLWQNVTYRDFPYAPYAPMMASIRDGMSEGDTILHSNKLSLLPSLLVAPDLAQSYILDPPGSPGDTLAPATRDVLGLQGVTSIEASAQFEGILWYVIFQRSIDEFVAAGHTTHPDLEWLQERFGLEREECWDTLCVFAFNTQHSWHGDDYNRRNGMGPARNENGIASEGTAFPCRLLSCERENGEPRLSTSRLFFRI